ncbi:hypothetical protein GCM10022198_18320 [Klugiella xanthotipulae]
MWHIRAQPAAVSAGSYRVIGADNGQRWRAMGERILGRHSVVKGGKYSSQFTTGGMCPAQDNYALGRCD